MPYDTQNFVVGLVTMLQENEQAAHDVLDLKGIKRWAGPPWNKRMSLAERILILSGDALPMPKEEEVYDDQHG